MKQLFVIAGICLSLVGCTSVQQHSENLKTKISLGDCQEANNYARQNFSNGDAYLALAAVAQWCKRDKNAAIEYLKAGAREGYRGPIDQLIELGVTPPEPTKRVVIQQTPAPQPQQVIIQQAPQQMNLGACIQDGGPLYCPNHPSSKSIGPRY